MALTKEDLQAIRAVVRDEVREQLEPIIEQQEVHNKSIINLEHNVMHELKMLNENLPNSLNQYSKLDEVAHTVDEHDHRIFALENR